MTKTATPNHIVNFPNPQQIEKTIDVAEQQDLMFYNSIKPQLDELVKNPSDETIDKILAYSKKK
ncbi:hypothetical protein EZ428_23195 [Pedobacter frigiditerrae]|uniref:Uncharacterized protein n=1 Tax=Pedobacter frigiditerrae TaxID=2530452 RepID=A0A4R0MJ32_9SPHI|nr:hypothetical protein [Pedobacter frigiditerrae]TCC86619.1 hypothetical protein EZ428_23195 [Pedobacter frigiditerrae]